MSPSLDRNVSRGSPCSVKRRALVRMPQPPQARGMKKVPLVVASTLVLASCDNSPAKDKARAATAEPIAVAAVHDSAAKYTFSNVGSKIEFVGAQVTAKRNGSFQTFTGKVNLVDNNP